MVLRCEELPIFWFRTRRSRFRGATSTLITQMAVFGSGTAGTTLSLSSTQVVIMFTARIVCMILTQTLYVPRQSFVENLIVWLEMRMFARSIKQLEFCIYLYFGLETPPSPPPPTPSDFGCILMTN